MPSLHLHLHSLLRHPVHISLLDNCLFYHILWPSSFDSSYWCSKSPARRCILGWCLALAVPCTSCLLLEGFDLFWCNYKTGNEMKITSLGAILWPKDTRNWWINSFLFLGEHFWGALHISNPGSVEYKPQFHISSITELCIGFPSISIWLLPSPPLSFLISSQPTICMQTLLTSSAFRENWGLRPLYCKRHFQSLEQQGT